MAFFKDTEKILANSVDCYFAAIFHIDHNKQRAGYRSVYLHLILV